MQTWRLVRLGGRAATQPGVHCGMAHEYLARPQRGGICQPVLFPPGATSAGQRGDKVEAFSFGSDELSGAQWEAVAYRRLARQVAARGIRCERCGARFEDLDRYVAHQC